MVMSLHLAYMSINFTHSILQEEGNWEYKIFIVEACIQLYVLDNVFIK